MLHAAWVPHHEFVHVLGFTAHDAKFVPLNECGPAKVVDDGKEFRNSQKRRAKWLWICSTCEGILDKNPEKEGIFAGSANGLIDKPNNAAQ